MSALKNLNPTPLTISKARLFLPAIARNGFAVVLLCGATSVTLAAAASRDTRPPAYHPTIDPANFQATVDNPYLPLIPGTVFKFTEKADGQVADDTVTVTQDTRQIMGVQCVVVHDVVREKGVLEEETYDWYAQDKEGAVWYFGEDTKEIDDNGKISTEGSWQAGVGGALPGLIMPAHPAPGEPFRQEYLAGHAEDMGQIVALNSGIKVPYGPFTDCVKTKEWSMIESGYESKWYARGIGVVREESTKGEIAELVSVTRP